MASQTIHVVGDRFIDFARENPGVITIAQLEEQLARGMVHEEVTFMIGQGIQNERLQRLQASTRLLLHPAPLPERAEPALIHKRLACNVMVSQPEQLGEDVFRAYLLLDDQCAEMSDHLTGRHVQGMVLAEAGRQMVVGVTERFVVPHSPDQPVFFVINQFDIAFHSFAFPVCTEIECTLTNKRVGKRNTASCAADIRFMQGGECVVSGSAKFSTYDASFMRVREAGKAKQVLLRAAP